MSELSDRELLELAAKAAGITYIKPLDDYDGSLGLCLSDEHGRHLNSWNPLTNDGDALRLAVRLKLNFDRIGNSVHASFNTADPSPDGWCKVETDPYAATRRAIVRAAAEIGRGTDGIKG